MTLAIAAVALLFASMGAFALAWPARVLALFGTAQLSIDGRNEVRAVYGGFGVGVAVLLLAALRGPSWAAGVYLTLAVALFGMAAGRVVSLAIDRALGRMPLLLVGVELAASGVLWLAFVQAQG